MSCSPLPEIGSIAVVKDRIDAILSIPIRNVSAENDWHRRVKITWSVTDDSLWCIPIGNMLIPTRKMTTESIALVNMPRATLSLSSNDDFAIFSFQNDFMEG